MILQLYQKGDYQRIIEQTIKQEDRNWQREQMKIIMKTYFITYNYQLLQNFIDNKINQQEYKQYLLQMKKYLFKISIIKQKYIEASQFLNEIEKIIFQSPNNYQLELLQNNKQLLNKRSEQKHINEIKLEIQQFKKIMKEQAEIQFLEQIGFPAFIISKQWLQDWMGLLNQSNQHFQKHQHNIQVPPIHQFDLIQQIPQLLIDNQSSKNYCNIVLRYQIQQNLNYNVLPKRAWKYIYQKYGGNQIRRIIISIDQQVKQKKVEIHPCLFKIFNMKNPQKIYYVQICKKQTIKDLKIKLNRIFIILFQNKTTQLYLYLIKQKVNLDAKSLHDRIVRKNIRLKLLNNLDIIQKIEITPHSIVIVSQQQLYQEHKKKIKQEKCGFCQKTFKLKFCKCRLIKYCNMKCLKAHRPNHKKECQSKLREQKTKNDMIDKFKKKHYKQENTKKIGLQNLGNTCYMNSGIQCLTSIEQLKNYFISNEFLNDINICNPLGTKGELAMAFAQTLRILWTSNQNYYSPINLKKKISKYASMFWGYSQHDSHQLVNYLLDGIHEDLNQVVQKNFIEEQEIDLQDQQKSKIRWNYYLQRNKSKIVDLMVGQFKSTLSCPDPQCKKISIKFEPFLSVSVPIPHLMDLEVFVIFRNGKTSQKVTFCMSSDIKVQEVLKNISRLYKDTKKEYFQLCKVEVYDFIKTYKNTEEIRNIDNKPYAYQIYSNQYDQYQFQQEVVKVLLELYFEKKKVSFARRLNLSVKITKNKAYKIIYERFKQNINYWYQKSINGKNNNLQNFMREKNELFHLQMNDKIIELSDQMLFTQKQCSQFCKIKFILKLNRHIQKQFFKFNNYKQSETKQNNQYKLTLYDCLKFFCKQQILNKEDSWYCSKCKKLQEATKSMNLYKTSKILIIQLKRFKKNPHHNFFQNFHHNFKINIRINFPIKGLNLTQYILSNKQKEPIIYDLFAVINHYGSLGGGHYTAICYNQQKNIWNLYNDEKVSVVQQNELVSSSAYVLFYRLRN